ncbi:MAG: hypothetical protein ACRDHY_06940 [Anaerolineales bacterium]
MTFNIAPLRLVKGENEYPEFRDALGDLQKEAIARASEVWSGWTFGGVRPEAKQFGVTGIMPRHMFGGDTATYTKAYGSQGSWANIFSRVVPEDLIFGVAGFAFTDPTLIFSQVRWEVEDRIYPIVPIEEAHGWGLPFAVMLKQDRGESLIIPEEQRFLLRGFQERATRGQTARIVPIGFMLYKNKDLVIRESETGN